MVTSQKGGVEKPREGSSAHKRAGNHKHSVSFRGRPKTKSFGQKWDEGFFGRNFQILEKTDRIIIACVLFSLSILERHEFLSKCYQLCWGPAFFFYYLFFPALWSHSYVAGGGQCSSLHSQGLQQWEELSLFFLLLVRWKERAVASPTFCGESQYSRFYLITLYHLTGPPSAVYL